MDLKKIHEILNGSRDKDAPGVLTQSKNGQTDAAKLDVLFRDRHSKHMNNQVKLRVTLSPHQMPPVF